MSRGRSLALLDCALVVAVSCAWACGPSLFECAVGVDGVDRVVENIERQLPTIADIPSRLDVFCVDSATINATSHCGRSGASDIQACTMWLGSDRGRARVYVRHDVPVDAALAHEAGHWLLWEQPGACASHSAECGWSAERVEALMK